MTRTARRRWTRELSNEVDGLAVGESGPVLVHGYEPPAGGKWVDDVIPGRLAALDRESGEGLWASPCEVGYGRGFGAGMPDGASVLVLGPSQQGHRVVRMALESGELLAVEELEAFDEALVDSDRCILVTPQRVWSVFADDLHEDWSRSSPGLRYHRIARDGNRVFAVYTHQATRKQGVQILDAETGKPVGDLLEPKQSVVHAVTAGDGAVTVVVSELIATMTDDFLRDYLMAHPEADVPAGELGLVSFAYDAQSSTGPRWFRALDPEDDEYLDVGIRHDGGRLYVVRGALLEALDLSTGDHVGDVTVPGLDERVGWTVSGGTAVVAEETRLSLFEVPH